MKYLITVLLLVLSTGIYSQDGNSFFVEFNGGKSFNNDGYNINDISFGIGKELGNGLELSIEYKNLSGSLSAIQSFTEEELKIIDSVEENDPVSFLASDQFTVSISKNIQVSTSGYMFAKFKTGLHKVNRSLVNKTATLSEESIMINQGIKSTFSTKQELGLGIEAGYSLNLSNYTKVKLITGYQFNPDVLGLSIGLSHFFKTKRN